MEIKFHTLIKKLDHLNNWYLHIPSQITQAIGANSNRRFLVAVNNHANFHGGLVALGKDEAYISISSKQMKLCGVQPGDIVAVELQPDNSKYGMEMPEELEVVLQQDNEGELRFSLLTPGRQRYIIHYVSAVKNSQLRIDRALLLIGNLKNLPKGKEDFKAMLGK